MRVRRIAAGAAALSLALFASGCTNSSSPPSTSSAIAPSTTPTEPSDPDLVTTSPGASLDGSAALASFTPRLFDVVLTQPPATTSGSSGDAKPPVVTGTELTAEQISALTSKLPAWEDPSSLAQPFAFPTQSSPRPRPGKTVTETFPPTASDGSAPQVDSGPLKVLRVQPEGEVEIAPYLAVTFNQPMVPIGTVTEVNGTQVNGTDVPVTIEPAIAGQWQWIGAKTLRFDADKGTGPGGTTGSVDRLPMATTFTVTVPAGTKSATGATLAEAATFTFTTPAPKVEFFTPRADVPVSLEPVFVATFDQRIDPAAVIKTIALRAGNDNVGVRIATAAEIEADEQARQLTKAAQPSRWIAFKPAERLRPNSPLRVTVGPGTPSAEGPRTTANAEAFESRTYGPLNIDEVTCDSGERCRPGDSIFVAFTNQLAAKANDASLVTITPELPAKNITVQSYGIAISGRTKAQTTYTITIKGGLTDVYGQALGADQTKTIKIGQAEPSLRPLDLITTLDPFATSPQLSVLTTNVKKLRVRTFAADPARFREYTRYSFARDDRKAVDLPPWTQLSDRAVEPQGDADNAIEIKLDLSKELDGKPGQVIVLVETSPDPLRNSEEYYSQRPALTWVQNSTMGVDAFYDADDLQVWATDLKTGAPIPGLSVSTSNGATASTNPSGLATTKLPVSDVVEYVQVSRGSETFILPVEASLQPENASLRWYVLDDRQIYRPGETISVKGWVRRLAPGGPELSLPGTSTVNYSITDAFGVELATGKATAGSLGGFDFTAVIPKTATVGSATIQLTADTEQASSHGHSFQVADFRRPEFEVVVQPESAPPFLSTAPVIVESTATYLSGGALPQAPVNWTVSTSETTFSPAGWDGFTFGIFQPWWFARSEEFFGRNSQSFDGLTSGRASEIKQYQGVTDADGKHRLQLDFTTQSSGPAASGRKAGLPDLPVNVSVAGTVTDVNRQAWSDQQNLLVHSANRYVGLRSDRSFVREGDPIKIETIVTDVDGKAQTGEKVIVTAGLVQSKYVNNTWTDEIVDPQTCERTSAAEAVVCEFTTPVGGQYRVTSVITDPKGGRNRTELTVWVSGAGSRPARGVEQERLTIIPDKKEYAPGSTATLLVQAPFPQGEGLAVVNHFGMKRTVSFTVANGSAIVELPFTEGDIGSNSVSIEVVGASTRTNLDGTTAVGAPQRPAYAVGEVTLLVPPKSKTLKVTATPKVDTLAPGQSTTIDVTVNDQGGAPVGDAEFAAVVVDEAVLGLTNYELLDPLAVFYGSNYSFFGATYGRAQVQLLDPDALTAAPEVRSFQTTSGALPENAAPAEAEAFAAETVPAASDQAPSPALKARSVDKASSATQSGTNPVSIRSNFDALALFQPTTRTNAAGKANLTVTLPDNLTRYRIMVVAVSGADRYGVAESNLTAKLPLGVRPSAPRFVNLGDAFEFPVVVQNNTTGSTTVDVVLQTANLDAVGSNGRRITIKAGDRAEVRFPVKARAAGVARFRATVATSTGGSGSADAAIDSVEASVPVFTPGTTEAFATYGTVDSGAVRQPVVAPTEVMSSYGGLEITTSSTSLQGVTDALLYVSKYEYQSADAYASRILSIGALRKVLRDFAADDLPSEAELNAAVESDLTGLVGLQNGDGGFRYWRTADPSEPYISVQATHALVAAQQAGYSISAPTLAAALQYLSSIDQYLNRQDYSQQERDSIMSYSLWVRDLAGQRDPSKAEALLRSRKDNLTLDSLAWLWGSVDAPESRSTIERAITNAAVDTAGAVSFTSGYVDGSYLTLQSDRRTDAIVLDALISQSKDSDLIPKVVSGLQAGRVKGRWNNIQENTFALLAFKKYYDTYESVTPNFVAKAWLGDQFAGEKTFAGRSNDRSQINVPMEQLVQGGNRDLVVAKDGTGRLYYRIGLRYVPADLTLDPIDRGFVVTRTYQGVDSKYDVRRDADGTWRIKAGAKVKVQLSLVAESQRTHVALIDPLAAGLEALNPALAVSQPVVDTVGEQAASADSVSPRSSWWWWRWYDFQQFRDDRSEAFATYLPAGVYDYSYIARATTPGTFVVPPTRAEEMYAPETFGRAATDRVIIE
jgi:alpha-2-macroglobulin